MGQSEEVEKALAWADDWGKCEFLSIKNSAVLAAEVRRLQAQLSQEIEKAANYEMDKHKAEAQRATDHELFLVAHRDNMEGANLLAQMRVKNDKLAAKLEAALALNLRVIEWFDSVSDNDCFNIVLYEELKAARKGQGKKS